MISPKQACPLFLIGALFALGCEDSPRGSESRPDLVKDFLHYYIEGPNQEARVFGATFLGMRSIQNPADMWALQEIISEVAPDFIVETGTFHGGSALYLATVLKNVNPDGKVITIDRRPWVAKTSNRSLRPCSEKEWKRSSKTT